MKTSNSQLTLIQKCVRVNNSNSNARASSRNTNQTTSQNTKAKKQCPSVVWNPTRVACWIIRTTMRTKSKRCSKILKNSSNQSKTFWPLLVRIRIRREEMKISVWILQEIALGKLETTIRFTKKASGRFKSIATAKLWPLSRMTRQVQVQWRAYEISFRWFQEEKSLNLLMNFYAILKKLKIILMKHLKNLLMIIKCRLLHH